MVYMMLTCALETKTYHLCNNILTNRISIYIFHYPKRAHNS